MRSGDVPLQVTRVESCDVARDFGCLCLPPLVVAFAKGFFSSFSKLRSGLRWSSICSRGVFGGGKEGGDMMEWARSG